MKPIGEWIPLKLQFILHGTVCAIATVNKPPPLGYGHVSGAGLGTFTMPGTVAPTERGLLATTNVYIRFPGGKGFTIFFSDKENEQTGTFYGDETVGAIVATGKFTFREVDLQQ